MNVILGNQTNSSSSNPPSHEQSRILYPLLQTKPESALPTIHLPLPAIPDVSSTDVVIYEEIPEHLQLGPIVNGVTPELQYVEDDCLNEV